MIDFINFYLIPGIVLGSIYALGAIGITLTFGILRFANFAHGEIMTLGAYLTLTMMWITGWHPLVLLPVTMALLALIVVGLDQAFFKPFRTRPAVILVIASFGLMLMIRSFTQFTWSAQLQAFVPGIQRPSVFFDVLRVQPKHIIIVTSAIVLMGIVHYVLAHTRIGKAMRAMSDSAELARLTGIDTELVIKATWILGAATAAAAGVFLAFDSHVSTMMGFQILLPTFAAAIVGGIGRPYGAMAGGLLIGITEELSSYPWIGDTPLLSPGYKAGVSFAIMVAVLIWRPSGLFRGRVF
jgi:branched-chain amino acid transport system permease protein